MLVVPNRNDVVSGLDMADKSFCHRVPIGVVVDFADINGATGFGYLFFQINGVPVIIRQVAANVATSVITERAIVDA